MQLLKNRHSLKIPLNVFDLDSFYYIEEKACVLRTNNYKTLTNQYSFTGKNDNCNCALKFKPHTVCRVFIE